jgi:hypothetical protein
MEETGNMYDYLKTLSFVKCRHTEDCCRESRLKKKKANFKTENDNTCRNIVPAPVQTHHIHTVQTVFVPTTHHHIIHQQPIIRVERAHHQPVLMHTRPASAPKVFINYVSPSNAGVSRLN